MAAYEGNLERYVRLRRPDMLSDEEAAIIRGIYHNTSFAKWWSLQDLPYHRKYIKVATVVRFIMVNDLSHITPTNPDENDMPELIWWPLIPAADTLRELARRRPDMKLQVAMACIAGDYRLLWDELSPEPCERLWNQARQQTYQTQSHPVRNYYVGYMEKRAAEQGIKPYHGGWPGFSTVGHDECENATELDKEPATTDLLLEITDREYAITNSYPDCGIYAGSQQANAATWELFMCLSEEVRRPERESNALEPLYGDWWREVHLGEN